MVHSKKRWCFEGSLVKKMVLHRTLNTQRTVCIIKVFLASLTVFFTLMENGHFPSLCNSAVTKNDVDFSILVMNMRIIVLDQVELPFS